MFYPRSALVIIKGDGWYREQMGAGICKVAAACKRNYVLNVVCVKFCFRGGVPFYF